MSMYRPNYPITNLHMVGKVCIMWAFTNGLFQPIRGHRLTYDAHAVFTGLSGGKRSRAPLASVRGAHSGPLQPDLLDTRSADMESSSHTNVHGGRDT